MTAPHDTPEAVERHAEHVASRYLPGTATMLRRLHKRAVDAERERDELQGLLVTHEICADRIKATARADALREAADIASAEERRFPNFSLQHAGEIMTARRIAAAILALIKKETPDAE